MSGIIRSAAALAAAMAMAGCMTIAVPQDAFFIPDSQLAARNITLPPPTPFGANAETIAIPYAGGRVAATRLRNGSPGAPLILFCGGNLFRRGSQGAAVALSLAPLGDVLLFDYPGYGDTPGTSDFATFRAVGQAVVEAARTTARSENRRLIAWGHSLGGPICAEAAAVGQADALVLEATTPSARAMVNSRLGLARPFVKVELDPDLAAIDIGRTLDTYPGRVVVLEAGRDETLAPALSAALARDLTARGVDARHLVFAGAGHADIRRQTDFADRLAEALRKP